MFRPNNVIGANSQAKSEKRGAETRLMGSGKNMYLELYTSAHYNAKNPSYV